MRPLHTAPRCEICGRPLADPRLIALGYGPDCAERRAAFYGGAGLSVEAVDELALSELPDVQRWLSSMRRALYHDDYRVARIFFENARRAAQVQTSAQAA